MPQETIVKIPVACQELSLLIGLVEREIVHAPASQKVQLEKTLATLQHTYQTEGCGKHK